MFVVFFKFLLEINEYSNQMFVAKRLVIRHSVKDQFHCFVAKTEDMFLVLFMAAKYSPCKVTQFIQYYLAVAESMDVK